VFEIEYLVQHGQCPDCARLAAKNTWRALVQVRQKVPHKRTFLFLEQLVLKHGAQRDTIAVKEARDGLDFFYAQRSHALKMVDFLQGVVPIRAKASERLLSSDTHTSTANYKFTYSVEIAPVCKDDLLALPAKLARTLGSIAPLVLATRVGNALHVLDPQTLQHAELPAAVYWRSPFEAIASVSDLVEFTVLDVEPSGAARGKWVLADAQVALSGAFRSSSSNGGGGGGKSGKRGGGDAMDADAAGAQSAIIHTRTHLGGILQPGDTVLGYHLARANANSDALAALRADRLPDVVLVRKAYPHRRKKNRTRAWKLRSIGKDAGEEGETGAGRGVVGRNGGRDKKKVEEDYEMFLRELEEDPEMRAAVNLYKSGRDVGMRDGTVKRADGAPGAGTGMDVDGAEEKGGQETDGEEDEAEADFPEVRLEELLEEFDEMTLGDGGGGGAGEDAEVVHE
jgi:nonsense-mediated mRNA decay protein 3